MRIISGTHRGRTITPPRNLRARPTTDFAKENLFNVLGNLVDFDRLDVLDLFAGTGSISYEFASRGAASVIPVELNAVHHNFIRKTASELGFTNIYPVKANALLYLKNAGRRFDVIFSDAPYDMPGGERVVELVFANGLLNEGGLLVFEHSGDADFTGHPAHLQSRSYGSVHFDIFRFSDPAAEVVDDSTVNEKTQ